MKIRSTKHMSVVLAGALLLIAAPAIASRSYWDTGYFNPWLESPTGWVVQVKAVRTAIDTESAWTIPDNDKDRGWLADKYAKAIVKKFRAFYGWTNYKNIEGGWMAGVAQRGDYAYTDIPYDIIFNSMMEAMRSASDQNHRVNVLYWTLNDSNGAPIFNFALEPQDTFHG